MGHRGNLTGIRPLLLNWEARRRVSSLTEAGTPRMVGYVSHMPYSLLASEILHGTFSAPTDCANVVYMCVKMYCILISQRNTNVKH